MNYTKDDFGDGFSWGVPTTVKAIADIPFFILKEILFL